MYDARVADAPHHDDRALTWAALLSSWTALAKASLVLPDHAEGARWRSSIPAIIELQATVHALAELGRLTPEERPVALLKAGALIDQRSARLGELWDHDPPEGVVEIILDAHSALTAARASG